MVLMMSAVEQEMIHRTFVGGKWVDSTAPNATFEVVNPATRVYSCFFICARYMVTTDEGVGQP